MANLNDEVEAALGAAARDPDDGVRQAVVEALESCDSRRRIGDILRTVEEGDMGDRIRALYALGAVRDLRATEGLVQVMRSAPADMRGIAIRLLGKRRDEQAIAPLMEALDDPNLDVRILAVESLSMFRDLRLNDVFVTMLPGAEEGLKIAILQVLVQQADHRAARAVLPLLQAPNPSIRRLAAEVLAEAALPPSEDEG
jgi:HEAT repeat protein